MMGRNRVVSRGSSEDGQVAETTYERVEDPASRPALNGPAGRPLAPGESTVVVGAGVEPRRPRAVVPEDPGLTLDNVLNILVPNIRSRGGEVEDPMRGAFVAWCNQQGHTYMTRDAWTAVWAEFQAREV